jgi:hypothetical protein
MLDLFLGSLKMTVVRSVHNYAFSFHILVRKQDLSSVFGTCIVEL